VAGEVVQDDNIAMLEDRDKALNDPRVEGLAIDWAV
jgi:hypothetical protein